ncbi:MAG: methyltransferase regulatory domain-containing protein [Rhodospirillaceae bacterium]
MTPADASPPQDAAGAPPKQAANGSDGDGRALLLPNDQAPAALNAAAVFCGFRPRTLEVGFTWAMIGCGDGFDALLAAAAHPEGQFLGLDEDDASLTKGRGLAQAAFLSNIRFEQVSYRTLDPAALPPLDFVVVNDLISRVDPETRAAVLGRAAQALKPGGIMLVDYQALPGWAAQAPLRDILFSVAADAPDAMAKARAGRDWLKRMREGNAKYFRDHPRIAETVDRLLTQDTTAVRKAFFDGAIQPFHFAQIQAELHSMGLQFAGRAELFLNIADFAIPDSGRAELRGAKSRAEFEALRDFFRNEAHRRDLFVKGTPFASTKAWEEAQWEQVVGCVTEHAHHRRSIDFGDVVMDYSGPPFEQVLQVAGAGAMPVSLIAETEAVEAFPPSMVLEAVRLLLAGGLLRPFAGSTEYPPAQLGGSLDPATPLQIPHPLNRLLVARAPELGRPCPLISKSLGGPVVLNDLEAMMLDALCLPFGSQEAASDGNALGSAETQHATLPESRLAERLGHRSTAEEKSSLHTPEVQAMLRSKLDQFRADRLPKLLELGIVEEATMPNSVT